MSWLAVGVGGALGAMARHGLNIALYRLFPAAPAPTGIFVINVLGSVAIGLLAGLIASSRLMLSHEARLFLVVGVLGGFTTFSSFSLDTLTLLRSGQIGLAAANGIGQLVVGVTAAAIGFRLTT